jgi:broad-specificity NMP kinase
MVLLQFTTQVVAGVRTQMIDLVYLFRQQNLVEQVDKVEEQQVIELLLLQQREQTKVVDQVVREHLTHLEQVEKV